ncbi:hypothetical protein DA69_13770 [Brevundimonas naejangsanensis]|uniref:DUF3617 family protein n=1 Tax=Brevundimonas naejangsanensis TaxID=588932 RepID=A0A172Y981_9CAUL|nr:DUF3617 family protein [Brevundimonas naejangsanensis]ANF55702.1 hypothetical protein DA69_13770 [Brevundimonas naejangsanensis]
MRSAIMGGVAVACLLGLSACGNNTKTEAPAADGAETASTAAAPAMLDAPKPGLWRVSTAMEGMPGGAAMAPQDVCIKEAKLEAPANAQQPGADCTTQPFARQGDAMVATSTCALPGNMKADSTIRVTGDFNSRYVTEVTTRMDPAPTPQMAQTKVTMTAERIGDCPASQ